jgi:hypothetical protein
MRLTATTSHGSHRYHFPSKTLSDENLPMANCAQGRDFPPEALGRVLVEPFSWRP